MADRETELEWARLKRIEAERMKAVQAIEKEKPSKANLAFLDTSTIKRGWSRDKNAIIQSAEKMGDRSILLAICGVALSFIGMAGGIVTAMDSLGLAGVIISGIPSTLGLICRGLALLMAAITVWGGIYAKKKLGQKAYTAMPSAIGAIIIIVIYYAIQQLING